MYPPFWFNAKPILFSSQKNEMIIDKVKLYNLEVKI